VAGQSLPPITVLLIETIQKETIMQASVEISMYPLGRDYIPDIKDFIDRMRSHPEITVEVNGMSSQIFGPFRQIMEILTREMEHSFEQHGKSVFVMKVINAHLQKQ
jgi:uncharacterized protein YqgV (UPF0045/DUF77 family)